MTSSSCSPRVQEYDFSSIPYPAELKTYSDSEIGVKVSLGIVVNILAVVGNILVIVIVLRFKTMRTTTNYYLVNLAISDMLVGLMPIWVHVVASVKEFWVFGSFMCKFNPFLQSMFMLLTAVYICLLLLFGWCLLTSAFFHYRDIYSSVRFAW
mgnify:CR=1 FL=1